MLSLIDLNPIDESYIYSALLYMIKQTKHLNTEEIPSTNLCELKHVNSQN